MIPTGTEPIYRSTAVNVGIPLHAGNLRLRTPSGSFRGPGDIRLEWKPRPEVAFSMSTGIALGTAEPEGDLLLWGRAARGPVLISNWNLSLAPRFSSHMDGFFRQPLRVGAGQSLTSLQFHIPNFPDFIGVAIATSSGGWMRGRTTFDVGDWNVIVDAFADTRRLTAELRDEGGYAITHSGLLRRRNGTPFRAATGLATVEMVGHLLSFARGAWSLPLLLVGTNAAGARVWEEWGVRLIAPAEYRPSWFDRDDPSAIGRMSAGYAERWMSSAWGVPLRRATALYVEANVVTPIDTAVVLAQIALELLSWALIVLERRTVTAKEFSNQRIWPASRKLRELLFAAGIPTAVPVELGALSSMAGLCSGADGPERVAFVRNRFIHPPRGLSANTIPSPAIVDAWRLSLHYLELVILHLSGYVGTFTNRITSTNEPVPW